MNRNLLKDALEVPGKGPAGRHLRVSDDDLDAPAAGLTAGQVVTTALGTPLPSLHLARVTGTGTGRQLEASEGADSSRWPEERYPHKRAGMCEGKGRMANPWGLYDTLGNVHGWREDAHLGSSSALQVDPVARACAAGVIRGGLRSGNTRSVGASDRDRAHARPGPRRTR